MNNKGGVGKTASATTVAHMLATLHNKKTLLIDLDPQMNATTMFCEVDYVALFKQIYTGTLEKWQYSIGDLLLDKVDDIHKCINSTKYKNLSIIPSFLTLSEDEVSMRSSMATPQQFRLKHHLSKIQDEFDFCVIDSSPSISLVNINGMIAADQLYIPLLCDGGSLLGVAMTMNLFKTISSYNPGVKIGGILFTRYDGRMNVSKVTYDLLQQFFSDYILPITIGTSKNLQEGSLMQTPLLEYDEAKKKNKITEQYMKLTEYILQNA